MEARHRDEVKFPPGTKETRAECEKLSASTSTDWGGYMLEKTSNNGGGAGKRVKMRGPRGEMARSLSLGCDVVDLLRILGFWGFGLRSSVYRGMAVERRTSISFLVPLTDCTILYL